MLCSAGSTRGLIKSATKLNNVTISRRSIIQRRSLKPAIQEGVFRGPPPPPINPSELLDWASIGASNKSKAPASYNGSPTQAVGFLPETPPDVIANTPESAGKLINQVGVQLLSPKLHSQTFPGVSLPIQSDYSIETSLKHLKDHGLDTDLASRLPETSFDLPALQGMSIDEHFYRIGAHMAEPWLSIANKFVSQQDELPAKPEYFDQSPGWTKYHPDGSFEHVNDLGSENVICFDVETLPSYSPF
ncbi:DNA-directed DNA polymerase gamma mip1, partial [Ceratobasidium sp. 428]